ncbi:MAG: helix-turn-helix domain-containing protein [Clostridia bacterium]|nr:helix-turn-helix domain-containing protein [Clostridia bacterium]
MRERVQRFEVRQTMKAQNFEVFHYNQMTPAEVTVHHHDFYEVFFFLGGNVSYRAEGQLFHLKPGDVLLINPMVLHQPIIASDSPDYERIILWIDKDYLNHFGKGEIARCFGEERVRLLHLSASVQRAELTELLGRLVRECYGKEYGADLYAEGLFLQVMTELNRLALKARPAEGEPSTLVTELLSYINEHYAESLSLEGLAKRFFISKYHLSHEFSRAVGTGVYRYIMLRRLTVAKQLLSDGVAPGEVYGQCGFQDYTSFFRAFKAEYGVNPRTFAEGH